MEHRTLGEFVAALRLGEIVPRPPEEDWQGMIARIHRTGTIQEVDEETFNYFLEVLPPKYMSGSLFAFAEGEEPLRLFWSDDHRHFCRPLTWDETKAFCRLARMPLPW